MSLLHALGWIVLAVALVAAWVWAVRRWTRPGPDPSRPLRAICRDGWSLAVYHRAPTERRFVEPVILSHGLAANRYCFDLGEGRHGPEPGEPERLPRRPDDARPAVDRDP